MIKFQLFDSQQSFQCHTSEISTVVVSIAHYMRGYFNYQALQEGQNFRLPSDAGYLNVSQRVIESADDPQLSYLTLRGNIFA
jgi:hypothetical protein